MLCHLKHHRRQPSLLVYPMLSDYVLPHIPLPYPSHVSDILLNRTEKAEELRLKYFILQRWPLLRLHTGRFIMFPMNTNIYDKKTKRPTLMELFTATRNLKKFSCGCEQFH